jgi:Hydrazine synthase alpha subunit middle domain
MKFRRTILINTCILLMASTAMILVSCSSRSMKGMIVLTQVNEYSGNPDFITGESWRYILQSRIVAFDPSRPREAVKLLTFNYYSACNPEISYDGRHMIFAAQLKQGESWHIYEMNLEDLTCHQVSQLKESCIDPAYLPGGHAVFSKSPGRDSTDSGHALYTCSLDGSDLKQITFHPNSDFASSVLLDGRILTVSSQVYPVKKSPLLLVLRPDGTKEDMYYESLKEFNLSSKASESRDGKIYFIETESKQAATGKILCIDRNRPQHTRTNITADLQGSFHSVFSMQSGNLLVTYRSAQNERYALFEFDPKSKKLAKPLYSDSKFDCLEAVRVEEHQRPRKLPSEVDMKVKTGLLMCQDINIMDPMLQKKLSSSMRTGRIEIMGLHASLGTLEVETDGSFYLKPMADVPFRLQTVDKNGKVISGPCAWMWLRPNERRGCVGCHEDHDLAPDNRVPLSVKKPPVIVPVQVKSIKEKQVTLE